MFRTIRNVKLQLQVTGCRIYALQLASWILNPASLPATFPKVKNYSYLLLVCDLLFIFQGIHRIRHRNADCLENNRQDGDGQ